jgi:CheY-like chemotaxis protein
MTDRASPAGPSTLNVLYVEDYALGATLVLNSLSRRAPDIHMDVVSTVAQAIERLTRHEWSLANPGGAEAQALRYDAVLTDLNLPDGLGLDILAHVRSRGLMLAVVILTGSIEEDTANDALHAGANGYLAKRGDYLVRLPFALRSAVDRFRSGLES